MTTKPKNPPQNIYILFTTDRVPVFTNTNRAQMLTHAAKLNLVKSSVVETVAGEFNGAPEVIWRQK